MANTLVIGGTSLIGRPLVQALLDRGDSVTIMHRSPGTPFGDRVDEVHADRNDPAAVMGEIGNRRYDIVFDNVYDWERGTTADQVLGTVGAISHDDLQRYVFVSSVAAYPEGGPHDEDADLRSASDPNEYGVHKANSERELFRLAREEGFPLATTRPAFVYGAHNPFPREAFFWDRLAAGRPIIIPEDGTRAMQWVHSEDIAKASIRAATMDAGLGAAFNLAGDPVSQNEFVRTLARVAGVEADLVHVPREKLLEAGGQLFQPPFYFGAYLDMEPIIAENDRVRERLGVELTPLEEGMSETFEWYRQQDRPAPDTSWEDSILASLD